MIEMNVMPPMFLVLEREAHMAAMVSATLAQHPGASFQYDDEGLTEDLCDDLDAMVDLIKGTEKTGTGLEDVR